MTDHFNFSSRDMEPEAAFDRYRELYSAGSDVARGDGPFHAEMRAWRLDRILLFDRRLSGVVHFRGERVASDGFDHFVLTYLAGGRAHGEAPASFELRPGDMILLDQTRAMRMESQQAHLITVSIARTVIEAAFGATGRLHGQVLQPPDNLVLGDFLQSLARRAPTLPEEAFAAVCRAFIELLASATSTGFRPGGEIRRLEFARREAVDRYVAAHFNDRDLSAASICDATGLSRSTLYRMFEKQGGVMRYIQTTRLDALRTALERGEKASLADLAQRHGFADENHMSRQFAAAYGSAPGAYRRAVEAAVEANDPVALKRRWAGWMNELD